MMVIKIKYKLYSVAVGFQRKVRSYHVSCPVLREAFFYNLL